MLHNHHIHLKNYTYKFNLTDAGTFWYHSHIDTKRGNGGYGFLIVNDAPTPLAAYDEERLVVLADWY